MSLPLLNVDLIIEARWVLPIVPKNQLLAFHSVVIRAGKIVDLCATSLAKTKYMPTELVVLDEHVLIPGLINLHTHAAMTLMRGLADDIALMPWLKQYIWPAEQQFVSEHFVRDGTLLACAEMLAGGITTFSDMYFYPQASAIATTQAGMRANLGLVVVDFATNYASDADDYLHKGGEAYDSWRDNSLISTSIAPHAPYTVSDKTFNAVAMLADQLGLAVHTHLHETAEEIQQSVAQYGVRPIQRIANLGLLGPQLIAAHCVKMLPQEIDWLANHGCHVVHCPSSNLKLASGIAPLHLLVEGGVNVGLGTDGAASHNRLDMFAEMRLAALLAKGTSESAATVTAHKALEMGTINAAIALGLDAKIGSIEVNKMADLAAVKLTDFSIAPCYDPISHLVYACGREHVTHTWVAGELRYFDGVFANIEPKELSQIIGTWQPKLQQLKQRNAAL